MNRPAGADIIRAPLSAEFQEEGNLHVPSPSPFRRMTADIQIATADGVGSVVLDRPKALNALTLPMIRGMAPALAAWAADPAVRAVIVRGAGDRAFCAGGDVRAIWEAGRNGRDAAPDHPTRAFFREEYRLNRQIHRFPKPYVALLDGITMGGGVGLSVHGSHRIVTEKTLFAMPETAIGLFPDVGATWFLTRCPDRIGTWLALTGARLKGADVLAADPAAHFVPSDRLPALEAAIRAGAPVDEAVAAVRADPGPGTLGPHRDTIRRCFAHATVEDILDALARDGSDFARETRDGLLHRSPTSLRVVLEQMKRGQGLSIEDALVLEYRLVQGCMDGHDFFEGIRAVLVDKDHAPKWRPARLDEVGPDIVERHFAVPAEGDLDFE
ncbi:enoyl-CoA hydratase/isomerase family protein [Stella sp.]|uniref:enoyl-CoA hydratase/isomerase family protein n=1 Tax=Stella sp. TaxID=2912054 RepID=UPI0035AE4F73